MASLQGLPNELLERIAASLCTHCSAPASCQQCASGGLVVSPYCTGYGLPQGTLNDKDQSRALGALCLTSRRLRDAATRPLYHRPNTKKWWLLTRTLLARPDLALQVKQLYLPDSLASPGDESAIPPEVLAYYKARDDAYAASLSEDQRAHRRPRDDALISGNTNAEVSIVTSLCRNVEMLEAVIGYFDVFQFCAPLSMPLLHDLELAHADTEGGIHLGNLVPLFKAAPNLRVIQCYAVAEDEGKDLGVTLDQLRVLELKYSAMCAEALAFLLKACPAVETLRYVAGGATVGSEQFNPSEARDVILRHGRKLKRVALDFTDADFWDEDWNGEEKGEVEESFKQRGIELELIL